MRRPRTGNDTPAFTRFAPRLLRHAGPIFAAHEVTGLRKNAVMKFLGRVGAPVVGPYGTEKALYDLATADRRRERELLGLWETGVERSAARWAVHDPATLELVRRVWGRADRDRWPLLAIAIHREADWHRAATVKDDFRDWAETLHDPGRTAPARSNTARSASWAGRRHRVNLPVNRASRTLEASGTLRPQARLRPAECFPTKLTQCPAAEALYRRDDSGSQDPLA